MFAMHSAIGPVIAFLSISLNVFQQSSLELLHTLLLALFMNFLRVTLIFVTGVRFFSCAESRILRYESHKTRPHSEFSEKRWTKRTDSHAPRHSPFSSNGARTNIRTNTTAGSASCVPLWKLHHRS